MNIFVLDRDPKLAAQYACDSHTGKMVMECLQMLRAYVNTVAPEPVFYTQKTNKPVTGFKNHCCTTWIGESKAHYDWLVQLCKHLNQEWRLRYNHRRDHGAMADLPLIGSTLEGLNPWPTTEHLSWAIAVGGLFDGTRIPYSDTEKAVDLYRQFYIIDKSDKAAWAFLDIPYWWPYQQFPAGMAFCKLNKAYFSEIDQVDAYQLNDTDDTKEYELAESFKRKRKKKEPKPPTLAEKIRNHIKSKLSKKIPRVSTIEKWIAENGKEYNRLIDLANDYIAQNHEYTK